MYIHVLHYLRYKTRRIYYKNKPEKEKHKNKNPYPPPKKNPKKHQTKQTNRHCYYMIIWILYQNFKKWRCLVMVFIMDSPTVQFCKTRNKKYFARSHTCIYKELNPKPPIFPILNQIPNLILKNQRKFRASCLPIEKAHEMLGNISDY